MTIHVFLKVWVFAWRLNEKYNVLPVYCRTLCKKCLKNGDNESFMCIIDCTRVGLYSCNSSLASHTDIVTCVALDKPGERLVTGSCDTTCAVWQFSSQVSPHPVLCISVCTHIVELCLYKTSTNSLWTQFCSKYNS